MPKRPYKRSARKSPVKKFVSHTAPAFGKVIRLAIQKVLDQELDPPEHMRIKFGSYTLYGTTIGNSILYLAKGEDANQILGISVGRDRIAKVSVYQPKASIRNTDVNPLTKALNVTLKKESARAKHDWRGDFD